MSKTNKEWWTLLEKQGRTSDVLLLKPTNGYVSLGRATLISSVWILDAAQMTDRDGWREIVMDIHAVNTTCCCCCC